MAVELNPTVVAKALESTFYTYGVVDPVTQMSVSFTNIDLMAYIRELEHTCVRLAINVLRKP